MAKVALLTTDVRIDPRRPAGRRDFDFLSQAAKADRFGVHHTTQDPQQAEIILFVGSSEPGFLDVRRHPCVRQMRERCFLVDSGDSIIPFLPGVYTSIERRWYSETRTRSGCYLRVFTNTAIEYSTDYNECDLLFSFLGSYCTAPVRTRLSKLDHSDSLIRDTKDRRGPAEQKIFADVLRRSKFVLCPRGLGPSSWRLFETMKAGRVPVIISDQWVPPHGPRWEDFSVRIPERSVAGIPKLLDQLAGEAEGRGRAARQTWEQWFSEETAFHRIVEWCLDMKQLRRVPESVARLPTYFQLFRPRHFKRTLLNGLRSQLIARSLPEQTPSGVAGTIEPEPDVTRDQQRSP